MKKVIVLVTTILFSLLLVSCSQDDTNKSERELRKGYKEAKVYAYFYKFGEIDKESKFLHKHITYDKEGNVATESETQDPKKGYTKKVYKYNQANMPIEIVKYDSDGQRTWIESMKYHPGDTIIAEKVEQSGKYDDKSKFEYKYDERGNEIYLLWHTIERNYTERHRIIEKTYNDKNQLVQKIYRRDKTNLRGEMVYGKPDTTIYIDEHGNIIVDDEKSEKKYNDKGQLIETTNKYMEDKILNILKYKYNSRGLLEEETAYDEYGEPYLTLVYEYK
jgi:hypothetical protein